MRCTRCFREWPNEFRFCPHDGQPTVAQLDASTARAKPTRLGEAVIGRRWRIRGSIGQGSVARVYLGDDIETGRPVAVKILDERHRGNADARQRFLREARAVASIGHPHIVKMLEAGIREDDGVPYLVMEFLFGEPFGRYLEREGAASPDVVVPALQQAAGALQAAHDKGVIHRDVKPDNLFLVGEPGDPYDLKVIDFGLSKLQSSQHTAAGIVMGTPMYMPPEQALAEGVDARSDVYGLGMVMYRAFAGVSPFEDMDDIQTIAHQLHTPPAPPSQIVPGLDGSIEAVILTAIRKRPENRYPTMAAFCDDLSRLEQGLPPQGARPVAGDVYEPRTKMGRLIAKSLGRTIGVRVED